MRSKEPLHRRGPLERSLNGKPVLGHKAGKLVGARRFIRIAAKPVVDVVVKAHSTCTIVIVEHVAKRISAGCRNRGKIGSLVQRTNQEADGRGRAAVKFLFPLPECAYWRSSVNRDSKQSARTDEPCYTLGRAPHFAGVVEDPNCKQRHRLRVQPEQIRGLYGPILPDIKFRKKAACGFDAVGLRHRSRDRQRCGRYRQRHSHRGSAGPGPPTNGCRCYLDVRYGSKCEEHAWSICCPLSTRYRPASGHYGSAVLCQQLPTNRSSPMKYRFYIRSIFELVTTAVHFSISASMRDWNSAGLDGPWIVAQRFQTIDHSRFGEDSSDISVQSPHDWCRQSRRGNKALP
jgi:hypothetical protein